MTPGIDKTLAYSEILVVDDTPESLKLLVDLLLSNGFRVRPTDDPRLALESAFTEPPDLILLDIRMPDMDGFEVCRRLKRDSRTEDIPVLFVSASVDIADQLQGFHVGGVDYISKPIRSEEVLARVGTHLELSYKARQLTEARASLEQRVRERTTELARSEARYRTLFESSQDAVMTLAPPTWRFTSGNPATLRMFGVSDEAHFTSMTPAYLSPERQPDGEPSREKAMDMIGTAMSEGSCFFEWTHKRLDDTSFPASVLLTRMELDGEPLLQATVRDLTMKKQAELQYKRIIQTALDGFLSVTQDGRFRDVNDTYCQMIGYTRNELQSMRITDIEVKERPEAASMLRKGAGRIETRHRRKDGGIIDVQISAQYFDGQPGFFVVFVQNITDRKKAERDLRQAAAVFENTTEGLVITDANKNIIGVNQAFLHMSGYSEQELIGDTPRQWRSEHHDNLFYDSLSASLGQTGSWRGEIWNRRKNGELFPTWESINAVRDDKGEVSNYIALISDVSAIKEFQEQVSFLTHHDPLTGLPNRLLFEARLEHSLQRAHREQDLIAVLYVDLDNFKAVNDALSHPVGDTVLQEIGRRLASLIRRGDTIARIGGDEFLIFLEGVRDTKSVTMFAEKLLAAVAEPLQIQGHPLHIQTSVGVSVYPNDSNDVTTLLKQADTALNSAKSNGNNQYAFYSAGLTKAAEENLHLENSLREAVHRREFVIYYQPQYALNTGRLIGAEALIRWRRPGVGLVSPDSFIPIAERTGLIVPIGEWVLRSACEQVKTWRESGRPIGRISVNLSVKQIRNSDIVKTVSDVLAQTGLDAQELELEITESSIMSQQEQTIDILERLRALGITLAIDDFGTGYSSLSHLKQLPVDRLKIDKSFIRDIPDDADDRAIAKAVIALGKSLELIIIAEGVETSAQERFLLIEGCDESQGYLFSRPLPAEQFIHFVEEKVGIDSRI